MPPSAESTIDVARWNVADLAATFRDARPFPYVVIDNLVDALWMEQLVRAYADEPATHIHDEIFEMMASGASFEEPVLGAFREAFSAPPVLAAISSITGTTITRVSMRAQAFFAGHYLLPHTDHQRDVGRAVAYAFYLDTPETVTGGELELFDGVFADGEFVSTTPAVRIAAIPNRLVLFDVGDRSLHQVREVIGGVRLSLSGWFYR